MLSPVKNIAFNGIYDLVVPNGTPKDKIEAKTEQIRKIIRDNITDNDKFYQLAAFDDRIRVVSAIDNPNQIANLFEVIGGEDLAKQYINRNRQEYRLNIQA
ncbi:hypothetical protein J6O86_03170 [bacterium]|nr:hypothetical protein [bacterium]